MGKMFVGGLPFSATDEDLKSHFEQIGNVASAKVITDRETHRSRGFGFVEMEDVDNVIEQLNGGKMDGRTITVSVARENERRERRGGRETSYNR